MTERLVKSKKRVAEVGEVFTPKWLVTEMLDELPQEVFHDPAKTFIDPGCGDGNFLAEVVKRKITKGATPLQALETTYGIDIMPDNVIACRQRLFRVATVCLAPQGAGPEVCARLVTTLKKNIRLGDTLRFEVEDIFSSCPSPGLKMFRREKVAEIALDSPIPACYTVGTVEVQEGR